MFSIRIKLWLLNRWPLSIKSVCVRVCARARVCVLVRACVCVCVCVCVCTKSVLQIFRTRVRLLGVHVMCIEWHDIIVCMYESTQAWANVQVQSLYLISIDAMFFLERQPNHMYMYT